MGGGLNRRRVELRPAALEGRHAQHMQTTHPQAHQMALSLTAGGALQHKVDPAHDLARVLKREPAHILLRDKGRCMLRHG